MVSLKTFRPKLRLENAPHSPLASGFTRSQSGVKLRFASFHARVTEPVMRMSGLRRSPSRPISFAVGYLPSVNLTAVLPSPLMSYDPAMRGVSSFNLGPVYFARMKPLGMYVLKPYFCSGNHACTES